jgi:hypothetical protein
LKWIYPSIVVLAMGPVAEASPRYSAGALPGSSR